MRWEEVFYEILDHETKLLQNQNRFFSPFGVDCMSLIFEEKKLSFFYWV